MPFLASSFDAKDGFLFGRLPRACAAAVSAPAGRGAALGKLQEIQVKCAKECKKLQIMGKIRVAKTANWSYNNHEIHFKVF
ncbi:MAG: hypothetical protein ACI4MP_14640 [Candidatus Ventricola sp.]